jgi:hypothetical protein
MNNQMKKLIFLLTAVITFTFCKGPNSGPLVKENYDKNETSNSMSTGAHQGRVTTSRINVKIEPCTGCITIGKLMADRKEYDGKVIKIKGQVTKFNASIMGKNWVHLQDGTEYNDSFDLTVTTDATATVGETLTFEGRITLDRDFGYGYKYDVLMEDAKSVN